MTRHYLMWEEGSEDDQIEVWHEEPIVVVRSHRNDMEQLLKLEQVQMPGVYVLMRENLRYVGQASGKIAGRLKNHEREKDWWTDVVFFAREDGRFDKSQLDYLEGKLIGQFKSLGFQVDNGNSGNSSHIEPYQQGRAEQSLNRALMILKECAGIDIFKKVRQKDVTVVNRVAPKKNVSVEIEDEISVESKPTHSRKRSAWKITDSTGRWVHRKSGRSAYIEYLTILATDEESSEWFKEFIDTYPKSAFTTDLDHVNDGRAEFYLEVLPGYYAYANFSIEAIKKMLKKIGKAAGFTVTMERVDETR